MVLGIYDVWSHMQGNIQEQTEATSSGGIQDICVAYNYRRLSMPQTPAMQDTLSNYMYIVH